MISILSMVKTGQYKDFIKIRFEFEFDNASLLPIGTYTWGVKTYFIDEGSKARDTINNIYYEYIKGKWSKIITPPIPTFKTPKNTTYNDNGEYSVSNNDFVGFNDIKVDVSSTPSTLIEKSITENGVYNAVEDEADGYSSVNVDVSNTYTAQDEGKVVSDGTLVAQTAMSEEVTENGTINTTLYNSVTVNVSGGGISGSDVIFYDYDGTLLYSYSAEDFLALTEMPTNYTYHEGFTAQGWNWSLANAKAYVSTFGKLNVGQMCVTSDGKTRFYLDIYDAEYMEWYLYASADDISTGATIRVDWGDGSEPVEYTSNQWGRFSAGYEYSSIGKYVVTLEVVSGQIKLGGDSSDYLCTCIEVGANVTEVGALSFHSLHSINIPSGADVMSSYAFQENQLSCLVLSNSVTTLSDNTFDGCFLGKLILPDSLISMSNNIFYNSVSNNLTLFIPNGVTELGDSIFDGCKLERLYIPNSVTTIYSNAITNRPLDIIIDNVKGAISDGSGGIWDPDSEYSDIKGTVTWLREQ